MENLISIKLFGHVYKFKTQSETVSAQQAADLLVEEVERIHEPVTGYLPDMTKITILISAALNFAQQINDLKKDHSELVKNLNERSARLLNVIDDGFIKNE